MNYKELPDITERQAEIIDLVYRFRFINRVQLQRYFNHKDARRINTWLRDLVAKGYLGRIYSKKLLENTKPAIYYLSNNGIIQIRYRMGADYGAKDEKLEVRQIKKFYEDKNASKTFINHCITLFELFLQLEENKRKQNSISEKNKTGKKKRDYFIETKTELWIQQQVYDQRYSDGEEFDEIKGYIPDLFIEQASNPETKQESFNTFFLELFPSHMPKWAIKHRIKEYIRMKEEDGWKNFVHWSDVAPAIILIFPHHRKINMVVQFIRDELERSYESEGLTFLLTTYQKAMSETLLGGAKVWKLIQEK